MRAYATNSLGTAYGNQANFTASPTASCNSFTLTHTARNVAPINKDITYGTVLTNLTGSYKCWITQNLGAESHAISITDSTETSTGWYWQFNRKQGYKLNVINAPDWSSTFLNENSNWIAANDPCLLLLGGAWRIPTITEWSNADLSGSWNNSNDAYNSNLKLHRAGYYNQSDGNLSKTDGYYWSNAQNGYNAGNFLFLRNGNSLTTQYNKTYGFSIRCIKD